MIRGFQLLALFASISVYGQFPRVNIPGSELRKISSTIVAGQEYELHVLLPGGYATSTKTYPVVYLMDSQWDFPLVSSIYGEQYYDGFIPELIVVGVTWGGTRPNPDSLRARDYTPTNENGLPQSGGASAFLSFMKNELFPFVESNYRADKEKRTLMGCSLGGLVTLYALFTEPELFTGYVAASPAIGWDREVLRRYEMEFKAKKISKPLRVYMTVGDVEGNRPGFERFAAVMKNSNYPSVSFHAKVLENTGHSGTKAETFTRGLQYVFEKPNLVLPNSVLERYTGAYEAPDGTKINLSSENGRLVLSAGPGHKMTLRAASETEFYSNSQFFNLAFQTENEKVAGFRLDRYGNSHFIKKTN